MALSDENAQPPLSSPGEIYAPAIKETREVAEIIQAYEVDSLRELVGQQSAMKALTEQMAMNIIDSGSEFDFIAAAGTDGMIWATQVRRDIERLSGGERSIPLVYVRDAKKSGGHGEHITGITDNPTIPDGSNALIIGDVFGDPDISANAINAVINRGYGVANYATVLDMEISETTELLQQREIPSSSLIKQSDLDTVQLSPAQSVKIKVQLDEERRRRDEHYAVLEEAKYSNEINPSEMLIESGAVTIREVPVLPDEVLDMSADELLAYVGNMDQSQRPFLYSSKNWGPGYVSVKEQVGKERVMDLLVDSLAKKLISEGIEFDFITANATGGMIPGYLLRERLQQLTGEDVPYVYTKNTRGENTDIRNITGLENNPDIPVGSNSLVVEELVNFASTTSNSAALLRANGYNADQAATILHYMNPAAIEVLAERGVNLTSSVILPEVIETARLSGAFSEEAVQDYQRFLQSPSQWQKSKKLTPLYELE